MNHKALYIAAGVAALLLVGVAVSCNRPSPQKPVSTVSPVPSAPALTPTPRPTQTLTTSVPTLTPASPLPSVTPNPRPTMQPMPTATMNQTATVATGTVIAVVPSTSPMTMTPTGFPTPVGPTSQPTPTFVPVSPDTGRPVQGEDPLPGLWAIALIALACIVTGVRIYRRHRR